MTMPEPTARTALRDAMAEALYQRDTAREALDAAAIVIASLRDQRDDASKRAEEAEARNRQYDTAIAAERRAKLTAEAAVRRVRALAEAAKRESVASFARRITGEPFPARLLADDVLAALDAEQPEPARRAEPVRWNVCPDCLGRHPDGASCALDAEESR